jgi:hypothetical protein
MGIGREDNSGKEWMRWREYGGKYITFRGLAHRLAELRLGLLSSGV